MIEKLSRTHIVPVKGHFHPYMAELTDKLNEVIDDNAELRAALNRLEERALLSSMSPEPNKI